MSSWRKLSERGTPLLLEEPPEHLPDYLTEPVLSWVDKRFRRGGHYADGALLQQIQLDFRLTPPLPLASPEKALALLNKRMEQDDTFALNVADYVLFHLPNFCDQYEYPADLSAYIGGLLNRGGSAWEIVGAEGDGFAQLARRTLGPTRASIDELPPSSRAREHLTISWNRLMGREPDPSTAYREAIKAVEAVAKPVILPESDRATLGTMIAAIRDAPQKWSTTLGEVEDIHRLMRAVWQGQVDRHGTDEPDAPLAVTQQDSDYAVHACIALVRLFAGGHVRRVDG